MMNSPEIKEYIKEYGYLFWFTPEDKKENIKQEFLVETILNYGDMDAVKKLFALLGIKETAKIFFNATERKKLNYYPEIPLFYAKIQRIPNISINSHRF